MTAIPGAAAFHQTAFVVRDLDAAVRHWSDELGIGPWQVWTMEGDTIADTVFRGEDIPFGIRHALAWTGGAPFEGSQFELVQPLFGPSIFAETLERAGEGAHHVGVIVDDHPAAVAELIARGAIPLQSASFGRSGDGRFAYFDVPGIPTVVELIRPPSERYTPEYVYPEPTA